MARFLWMENRLGKRSKRRRVLAPSSRHRAFFRATVPDRICRRKIGKKEIDAAIRKVGLDPEAKKHVGKYSLGMRQRLGIAQAIMEEPSLLILDEPMNGLDNQGVQEMRQLFLKLKDEGKTILLASHNREDIAALCDTTVEIDRGKIVG